MLMLAIETSCDETAAAVVARAADGTFEVLSSAVASQIELHARYGGVVPEVASRAHIESLNPVVAEALLEAGVSGEDLHGVAATAGPGLVGSLLVGLSYAKSLAYARGIPLVGVNHVEGHIFSAALEHEPFEYPAVALVVSGGHTNLFLMPEPERYILLGRTRDDAAGEAYDKVAKMLGLGYPGGPVIDRLAATGDPDAAPLVFKVPQMHDESLDFSFSGLKTAVLRYIREHSIEPVAGGEEAPQSVRDLAASFQRSVVWSLRARVRAAIKRHSPRTVVLAGGVACNSALRAAIDELGAKTRTRVVKPSPALTTDNAAMIAAAGYAKLVRGVRSDLTLNADPSLRVRESII